MNKHFFLNKKRKVIKLHRVLVVLNYFNTFIILDSRWTNVMWKCLTTAKPYSFTALSLSIIRRVNQNVEKWKKIVLKAIFQRKNFLFHCMNFETHVKVCWKLRRKLSKTESFNDLFDFRATCLLLYRTYARNQISRVR